MSITYISSGKKKPLRMKDQRHLTAFIDRTLPVLVNQISSKIKIKALIKRLKSITNTTGLLKRTKSVPRGLCLGDCKKLRMKARDLESIR
jgi:hypothetical protein